MAKRPHSRAREEGKERKAAFLAQYERTGSISEAAKRAGMDRKLHYRWLVEDAEYAERFRESDNIAVQALVDEAKRRAVDGVQTPKGVAGQAINVLEYSDRLLEFLIKGRRPEIYGDKFKQELSGPGGTAIAHSITVEMVMVAARPAVLEVEAESDED